MARSFRGLVVILASIGALLGVACAGNAQGSATARAALNAQTERELGCTPLHVIVGSGRSSGWGSGVALSPRVVITAGHVVPAGATYLTVFIASQPVGEAVSIERVVRGSPEGWWGGDWAIIVLKKPFLNLNVVPAMVGEVGLPELGQELAIAGFPYADPSNPAMDRDAVVMCSRVISRPPGIPENPQLIFAEEMSESTNRKGLSGAPVFVRASDGAPKLIGVYLGTADRSLMGVSFDRPLVVQRLPVEEARRAIQDADASR